MTLAHGGEQRIMVALPEALRERFFDAEALGLLERWGAIWTTDFSEARVHPLRESCTVLIGGWGLGRLGPAELDAFPRLGLIAYTGSSVKPFITEECFARGILISQAGAAMAAPVAEVSLAFTLALLHRVPYFDHALHAGVEWERAEQAPPQHEISGASIGVIGASRTGRAYTAMVRALGAHVLMSDPTLGEEDAAALGVERADLDTVLRRSRILALHAPSLPETRHLIGARELSLMPDGAGLVNTARSWLVDERALLAEVSAGRLDAALDVFDDEPLPVASPFRGLPNVLLVPHKAAGTVEGRRRGGHIVLEEIAAYREGRALSHTVSPEDLARMA